MQKIMEPAFEIIYLLGGLIISLYILFKSNKNKSFILFALMGLLLIFGDSFHLVPRIINSWELGDENIHIYLGIGKLITSITMTIFYVMLYWFFKIRYNKKNYLNLDLIIYFLAIIRITLCLLPYNDWTNINPPYIWGIYRNIPFVILGILIVIILFKWNKENNDKEFRFIYIAISLSFIFYLLTVTLASINPLFGLMMLPKTICYVWILLMGVKAIKHYNDNRRRSI